jgi:hypothetical protein
LEAEMTRRSWKPVGHDYRPLTKDSMRRSGDRGPRADRGERQAIFADLMATLDPLDDATGAAEDERRTA